MANEFQDSKVDILELLQSLIPNEGQRKVKKKGIDFATLQEGIGLDTPVLDPDEKGMAGFEPGPNEELVMTEINARKKKQIKEVLNQIAPNEVLGKARQLDAQEMSQSPATGAALANSLLQAQGRNIPGQPIKSPPGAQEGFDQTIARGIVPPEGEDKKAKGSSVLKNLLIAVGAGLTAGSGGDASSILSLAKSKLEQPAKQAELDLKKREQDRKELKDANDLRVALDKAGDVDALTPESAGKFNLLIDGGDATKSISNLLGSNVTKQLFAQGIPNFLKSSQAKELQSSIERAVQARTRIETGAALQPDELKMTVKRFMPQGGDSTKDALKRLKPLNTFFEGSLNVADPTGTHRNRAKGSSVSMDAIQAEKKRRGIS